MALGVKYQGRYIKSGNTYKVELLLEGYASSVIEIDNLMPNPVNIRKRSAGKDGGGVVLGSELEFNFYSSLADAGQFDEIYTGEWKDWQLKYYRDSTLIWQGWLKPENLSRELVADQYTLSVSATDGLADLKDIEYTNFSTGANYEDRVTILTTVKRILEHIGIDLDIKVQLSLYENTLMTSSENAIFKVDHDSTRFRSDNSGRVKYENCFFVLEEILRPFNVEMYQSEGNWWIQSRQERSSYLFLYDYTALTQTSRTLTDVSIDISSYDFKNRGELQVLKPVQIHETTLRDKGVATNLITNGDFSSAGGWTNVNITGSIVSNEYEATATDDTGYLESDAFTATAGSESYLKVIFQAKLKTIVPSGDKDYFPEILCQLVKNGVDVTPSGQPSFLLYEGAEYANYTANFPISLTGSDYKLRFNINGSTILTYTSVIVNFDNVSASMTIEDASEVTTDTTLKLTNDSITASAQSEDIIYIGDTFQSGSLGGLEVGGTKTEAWNRYNKTDDKSLLILHSLEYALDKGAYKDYLRLDIMDVDDNIRPHDRIKIDSIYYRQISYSKSHQDRILTVELVELLTSDPSYSTEFFVLNSVDGESVVSSGAASTGTGASIDDGSTSSGTTWSSTKIDSELNTKQDTIPANTYEPYDTAIVKSDEAETITSDWVMADVSATKSTVRSVSSGSVFFVANDGTGNDLLKISRETGNVIKFDPYTTGSFQFTKAVTCDSTFTATNFIDSSDRELKKDVKKICNCYLKKFDKIKPIQYRLKEGGNSLQFGVIAQDIEKQYPNIVHTKEGGFKGVNYRSLAMITLSKVQAQQKEIDELRKDLNRLEEKFK